MRGEEEIKEKLVKLEGDLRKIVKDPALVGGGLMISLVSQCDALRWVLEIKEDL